MDVLKEPVMEKKHNVTQPPKLNAQGQTAPYNPFDSLDGSEQSDVAGAGYTMPDARELHLMYFLQQARCVPASEDGVQQRGMVDLARMLDAVRVDWAACMMPDAAAYSGSGEGPKALHRLVHPDLLKEAVVWAPEGEADVLGLPLGHFVLDEGGFARWLDALVGSFSAYMEADLRGAGAELGCLARLLLRLRLWLADQPEAALRDPAVTSAWQGKLDALPGMAACRSAFDGALSERRLSLQLSCSVDRLREHACAALFVDFRKDAHQRLSIADVIFSRLWPAGWQESSPSASSTASGPLLSLSGEATASSSSSGARPYKRCLSDSGASSCASPGGRLFRASSCERTALVREGSAGRSLLLQGLGNNRTAGE
jgi:hypothetical protein